MIGSESSPCEILQVVSLGLLADCGKIIVFVIYVELLLQVRRIICAVHVVHTFLNLLFARTRLTKDVSVLALLFTFSRCVVICANLGGRRSA